MRGGSIPGSIAAPRSEPSTYWSVRESEFATDVLFVTPAALQAVYPRLVHHAIEHFQTGEVLRFLGRQVPGRFQGEAHSTLIHRPEGLRIRHWLDENSIKMYDKAGRVLRVEMTLNNPTRLKVLRRRPSDRRLDWLPLRRGIADERREDVATKGTKSRRSRTRS